MCSLQRLYAAQQHLRMAILGRTRGQKGQNVVNEMLSSLLAMPLQDVLRVSRTRNGSLWLEDQRQ